MTSICYGSTDAASDRLAWLWFPIVLVLYLSFDSTCIAAICASFSSKPLNSWKPASSSDYFSPLKWIGCFSCSPLSHVFFALFNALFTTTMALGSSFTHLYEHFHQPIPRLVWLVCLTSRLTLMDLLQLTLFINQVFWQCYCCKRPDYYCLWLLACCLNQIPFVMVSSDFCPYRHLVMVSWSSRLPIVFAATLLRSLLQRLDYDRTGLGRLARA